MRVEEKMTLVIGSKEIIRNYLNTNPIGSYVYILRRANSIPFYIGKGGGGPTATLRLFDHENEARRNHNIGETNPYKCNAIRKILKIGHEIIYEIESAFGSDELEAYNREAELIAHYRPFHANGCLTNLASATGNTFGQSEYSREKHSATLSGLPKNNPERLILNEYLAGIGKVDSVPIKPISQMKPIRHSTPHPQPRKLTPRLTYALIASAAAHRLQFSTPLKIPRCFIYKSVTGIIENGVSRDILRAGLAIVQPTDDPRDEIFTLNASQVKMLIHTYGHDELLKRDLI